MSFYEVLIYFFSLSAALAALALLVSKNLFYGALWIVVCLLSIAAIYVLAFAEFVAVTQILVYAGGILVVIIFGILLTAKLGHIPLRVQHKNIFSGFLIAGALLGLLIYLFSGFEIGGATLTPIETHPDLIEKLGIAIMTEYVVVFEVAAVLLLIALIGAAVIASHKPGES